MVDIRRSMFVRPPDSNDIGSVELNAAWTVPDNEFGPAFVFCFNVGVEIGQLLFVALILAIAALFKRLVEIPRTALVTSAYSIGIIAVFWTPG